MGTRHSVFILSKCCATRLLLVQPPASVNTIGIARPTKCKHRAYFCPGQGPIPTSIQIPTRRKGGDEKGRSRFAPRQKGTQPRKTCTLWCGMKSTMLWSAAACRRFRRGTLVPRFADKPKFRGMRCPALQFVHCFVSKARASPRTPKQRQAAAVQSNAMRNSRRPQIPAYRSRDLAKLPPL
jgi:hypothetical protein